MLHGKRYPMPPGPAYSFQWAPTLGGECYIMTIRELAQRIKVFQWAPTLGGECYWALHTAKTLREFVFQWAPTLGGECYGNL